MMMSACYRSLLGLATVLASLATSARTWAAQGINLAFDLPESEITSDSPPSLDNSPTPANAPSPTLTVAAIASPSTPADLPLPSIPSFPTPTSPTPTDVVILSLQLPQSSVSASPKPASAEPHPHSSGMIVARLAVPSPPPLAQSKIDEPTASADWLKALPPPPPAALPSLATPSAAHRAGETPVQPVPLAVLFAGGAESLVAKAVGSAEGTRTPKGERTPAFFGHRDPGNGVWNMGSFSYQHGATSPDEADEKQLRRLYTQAETLREKAQVHGLSWSLEQELNGIDLANQAPEAALGQEGYVDRLAQAQQIGLASEEAIVWARTRAFLDPNTQRWNAPGLGNDVHRITADQERRKLAIDRAIAENPLPLTAIADQHAVDIATQTQATELLVDDWLQLDMPPSP